MIRRLAPSLLPFVLLAGLGASAWLLVHYLLPGPMVCGGGGGCETVRTCAAGHLPGGVSWPVVGVAAFAAFFVASLVGNPRVRRALPVLGILGALTGLALVVLQRAGCHAWCPYCLVVDTSGLVAGLLAWFARESPGTRVRTSASVGAAFLVAGIAGWFGHLARTTPTVAVTPVAVTMLPAPIASEQRPGVVTIVEFADFECPYCREEQTVLAPVLASYGSRVRLVRKHVPLSFHPHAETAARAACCAEEQGRGTAMADALFATPADELTREGCEQIATRLGVDTAAYRACLDAPRTTARLARDRADARTSDVHGLPTMYIGSEMVSGAIDAERLRASIDRSLAHRPAPAPPG